MEWIPIERVLPENNRAVLVYEKNYNNIYTAYYDSAYGWMTCNPCVNECFGEHLDVVAWMPLPKPYTADTPQTETKGVRYCNECKWFRNKQVCGRCRSRNLFCEAEPQPRCPKCGKRGYIRSLESMGVKLKVSDEYRWKCTNCNKYFKEEPKDEP